MGEMTKSAIATQKATLSPAVLQRRIQERRNIWLVMGTVALILMAWGYGYFTSGADIAPLVPKVLPGAVRVEVQSGLFLGFAEDGSLVGYAASGEAPGYGGPLQILVGVNLEGQITGAEVIQQRETPGFYRLVQSNGLVESLAQKQVTDPFHLSGDLDAVSGATLSAEGIAAATRRAVRTISADGLDQPLPVERQPIKFGIPEIVLILLYAGGYFGHKLRSSTWKRRTRWLTLLIGMVVLGFIYTAPLTISQVISLLSGYWPDWHNNIYWYLLIGGILFVTTVDAKNPYCNWFCPFGAVQECLSTISGAKYYKPRKFSSFLTWMQRGLALLAILIGLALRRPGVAGYEPFQTMFDLRGTGLQWAFLILIILSSLLIYRPFCNYLCPLDPVVDFVGEVRRRTKEVWRKWQMRSIQK